MSRPLDILMLSAYFEAHRSGIEIIAGRLGREFVKLGRSVTWAAASGNDEPPKEAASEAVPLASGNAIERWTGIPVPLPSPRALYRLRQYIERADIIFIHDSLYLANIAAFIMARFAGKPVVVTQHIGEVPYRNIAVRMLMRCANRMFARPILSRADQVVFYNQTAAGYFRDVEFAAKPVFIANGVDADFYPGAKSKTAALRRGLDLPADKPVILFVGRFVEKKGVDFIRETARLRPDLSFVMAGWGPVDPQIWGLKNIYVRRDVPHAGLADLYRASDVFVLPSVGEGFPLVVQEALACGLPVICSEEVAKADIAAMPYLRGIPIRPGASVETAAEIAREIDSALKQPPEAAIARAEFAANRYNWKRAAQAYDEIFARLSAKDAQDLKRVRGVEQGLKYVTIGAFCAGLHNIIMIAGSFLGLHHLVSTAISFVTIVPIGYALHCAFTYRETAKHPSFPRYVVAMAANFPLWIAAMFLLVDFAGIPMWIAAPATTVALFTWNFFASRWAIARAA